MRISERVPRRVRRPRAAAAAGFLGLLAACDPAALGGPPDRASVVVAGRSVTIAAPPGFCIDAASTNVSASGAFVMASDCVLLGGRPVAEGDAEGMGAVLTASVSASAAAPDSLEELEALAGTAQGRAMLSRSGRGDSARILATRSRNGVLYILIEDRGPQPIAGIEPRFWRAFLDVGGQMTVLSVLGFEGAGVGPTEGLALLQRFAGRVQAANAAS